MTMTQDYNNNISDPTTSVTKVTDPSTSPSDTPPPQDDPTPPHFSFLMALLAALINVTNSQYNQQAADAATLVMDQNYQAAIAQTWNDSITAYMNTNDMSKPANQEKVSQAQTEMTTYGNQADATTHGMQSTLDTDVNNTANEISTLGDPLKSILAKTSQVLG